MTSRTFDIYCENCGKYFFSLQPDDRKGIAKQYFCKSTTCNESASMQKLKGKDVIIVPK